MRDLIEPAHLGACIVIPLAPSKRVEIIVLKDGIHLIVVRDEIEVTRIDQGPSFWPS